MNQQKVIGTRFEVWLELLLDDLGFQNVLRNVEYRKVYTKKKRIYRQVDLTYDIVQEGRISQVILEAKYSSNGEIKYKARSEVEKGRTDSTVVIRGPLEQIAETKNFVGADIGCLVTNSRFDDQIRAEAKRYGILIMEGDYLAQLHQKRGGKSSDLNQQIQATNINNHNLHKNIIYI